MASAERSGCCIGVAKMAVAVAARMVEMRMLILMLDGVYHGRRWEV